MIGKLRRKLILTTVLSLVLIFAVMVAAINIISNYSSQQQISTSLEMLVGKYTNAAELLDPEPESGKAPRPEIPASKLARIRNYCIIRLDRSGELHEWKSEKSELYDDDSVAALVSVIEASGKDEGRVGESAYLKAPRKYGSIIAVIDIGNEISYSRSLLKVTLITGSLFCLLLCVLAVMQIRRLLRPVGEAFTKQRQFVWDASHELKTPLAVISANAQVLEHELGENEYLGYIVNEARSMNTLVQNLLTLARMDSSGQKPPFESFDLGRTLLAAALPMEGLAFEHGKTLEVNASEGIYCVGNEALIRQLAVILLSNALEHSGSSAQISLTLRARGDRRVFSVHNTLSYIPPEEQKRIFDRFYRSDSSRSSESGGSGLGLAIAKSIVQLHRGSIKLESSPENGTCFTVTLPGEPASK